MISTVGDLRRALEGVSDGTPLVMIYLNADQRVTDVPVGNAGVLLNHDGAGSVFTLESADLLTLEQRRVDLLRRLGGLESELSALAQSFEEGAPLQALSDYLSRLGGALQAYRCSILRVKSRES